MPTTLGQIRNQLSAIEPDETIYAGIGSADIPVLAQLLQDDEAWMAARAVFALSRVPDAKAVTLLSRAATDSRQEVRVAVAASVAKLTPTAANTIILVLLTDGEPAVRRFAVEAVSATHNAAVHAKLRDLVTRDPAVPLRDMARSKLQELKLIPN